MIIIKVILTGFLLFSGVLLADVPANQVKEVTHLLNYIRNSDCLINRNGTNYKGIKSVNHIAKKYAYFINDIKSTEDFIKFSATKSTMSGKFYMVACQENEEGKEEEKETVKTQDWLMDELRVFRLTQNYLSETDSVIESVLCKDPRPQICTMEYVPVCATLKNGTVKTYASGCSACSDIGVVSYKPNSC